MRADVYSLIDERCAALTTLQLSRQRSLAFLRVNASPSDPSTRLPMSHRNNHIQCEQQPESGDINLFLATMLGDDEIDNLFSAFFKTFEPEPQFELIQRSQPDNYNEAVCVALPELHLDSNDRWSFQSAPAWCRSAPPAKREPKKKTKQRGYEKVYRARVKVRCVRLHID